MSRPQGWQCLVWTCPASEEGLVGRGVTQPRADMGEDLVRQVHKLPCAPGLQEAAGANWGWENFTDLPFLGHSAKQGRSCAFWVMADFTCPPVFSFSGGVPTQCLTDTPEPNLTCAQLCWPQRLLRWTGPGQTCGEMDAKQPSGSCDPSRTRA